jgi:adenylate kinase family enzyme
MGEGRLVFFSGKMGAGKTTYAKKLSREPNTIYLSEDEILSFFYPDEVKNIEDYVLYSNRIKPYIMNLVKSLTENGLVVIMDFPGNTVKQREWFKNVIDVCKVDSKLIYLKTSDEICIHHVLMRRQEEPTRHRWDNEKMFYRVTKYFQEPTDAEGFNLEIIAKETI